MFRYRQNNRGSRAVSRKLRLESLENRELLSADGLGIEPVADGASTLIVNTTVDDSHDSLLSLKEALASARSGDTIEFDQTYFSANPVYQLTERLSIGNNVTIDASSVPGFKIAATDAFSSSGNMTIRGVEFYGCEKVLTHSSSTSATFENCVFTDCVSPSSPTDATVPTDAIISCAGQSQNKHGTLTIKDSRVENCGGNAFVHGSFMTINCENSTFTGNDADSIFLVSQCYVTVAGSTFGGENDADGNDGICLHFIDEGGASKPSSLDVENSTFQNNNDCCVDFSNSGALELTFANSSFIGNETEGNGAAICMDATHAYNGAQSTRERIVHINNCEFADNKAALDGGAIYSASRYSSSHADDSATLIFEGTVSFSGNESLGGSGGAIYAYQIENDSDRFVRLKTAEGATLSFDDNKASANGGAIALAVHAIAELTGATFTGNRAENGGAIASYDQDNSVLLTDCSLTLNSARELGGGVYSVANFYATGRSSKLSSNGAKNGGAIYNTGIATVAGGIVAGNVATENGGFYNGEGVLGINAEYNSASETFTPLTTATTIQGNEAVNGGAIYCVGLVGGSATFTGNEAVNGGAVYLVSSGTFAMRYAGFVNNSATNGGAFYVPADVKVELTNSTVSILSGNEAKNGGAFYNLGTLDLTDIIFADNAAKYGGAIYNMGTVAITGGSASRNEGSLGGFYYGSGIVGVNATYDAETGTFAETETATTFSENVATSNDAGKYGSGGAFYITTKSGATGNAYLNNATFEFNEATKYGGAVANYGIVTVVNSSFSSNEGGDGSAIQTAGAATIVDCSFSSNEAQKRSKEIAVGDFGGNGGAIFASNNGSSGATSTLTLEGRNLFQGNTADNAGGAIDLVSGTLAFGDGATEFSTNYAGVVGGALVVAGDVDFGSDNPHFEWSSNTSGAYAATVAVNSSPTGSKAVALREGFGLGDSYDEFDAFVRTGAVVDASLSFEYLLQVAGVDSGSVVNYRIWGAGTDYETIGPNETIPLDGEGTYTIAYYVDDASDVELKLTVTVGTDGNTILARKIDMSERQPGFVGFALVSYGKPVSKWSVTWGDDNSTETVEALGYSQNVYKLCETPGFYKISLSATYADGSTVDFGEIGSYNVEASSDSDDSGALLDDAFADEDFLIGLEF